MPAIPRQVEYALMALVDMNKGSDEQLFAVRELCERHGVPFDVLSKAMQRLTHVGILCAVQGTNGGYRLAKDLAEVTLLDIIDAVSGEVHAVNCLHSEKSCPFEVSCNVTSIMTELDERLREFYSGILIGELVGALRQGCTNGVSLSSATR